MQTEPFDAPSRGLSRTPTITAMRVVPVAGRDGMLLNLSGAHGPFFTRNLVILTDSTGATGLGEVAGGERVRSMLEEARDLVAQCPLIKVATRTELSQRWSDLIDLDAGRIATGHATIEAVGRELFRLILDVASGRRKPWSDRWGLFNDLTLFNPAPIT